MTDQAQKPFRVFVIRDFEIRGIQTDLESLVQRGEDSGGEIEVVVPGLAQTHQGPIFANSIRGKIGGADMVLALCDLPNANVGFEIGYALGCGAGVVLAHTGVEIPKWLTGETGSFPGFHIAQAQSLKAFWDLIQSTKEGNIELLRFEGEPDSGDRSLVLSPRDKGESHRDCFTEVSSEAWTHRDEHSGTFMQLADDFDGLGRLIWIITPTPPGTDRDGAPNAQLSVVAGLAEALDQVDLQVLRDPEAREVVDVEDQRPVFESLSDLKTRAEMLLASDAGLAAVQQTDPLEAYARALRVSLHIEPPFGFSPGGNQDCAVELRADRFNSPRDEAAKDRPDEPFAHGGSFELHQLLAGDRDRQPSEHGCGGQRWILLGEPGAGKTTSVKALGLKLLGEADGPLPIVLALPELVDGPEDLFLCAARSIVNTNAGLNEEELARSLRSVAEAQPRRLWILLDSWDEVLRGRRAVQSKVNAWVADFPEAAFLITSRPAGYNERGDDRGRDFPGFESEAKLKGLDPERRAELTTRWLGAQAAGDFESELEKRPPLRPLALNPLLLSFLAKTFQENGSGLPGTRGELYGQTIDLLLKRGDKQEATGLTTGLDETLALLPEFALQLLLQGQTSWSDEEMSQALDSTLMIEDRAGATLERFFIPWAQDRRSFRISLEANSGLLGRHDGPNGKWRFLHRSLGEFLAARALLARSHREVRPILEVHQSLTEPLEESEGRSWRASFGETLSLAADLTGSEEDCLAILEQLDQTGDDLFERTVCQVDRVLPRKLLALTLTAQQLSGDLVLGLLSNWQAEQRDAAEIRELLNSGWGALSRDCNRLRERQAILAFSLERHSPMSSQEWTELFEERLGLPLDSRPEIHWIEVPKGNFTMGSMVSVYSDEKPIREVAVKTFSLAATPVTNEQLAPFARMEKSSKQNDEPKHPATNVTFWEAWLFCRWLGGRLPSEAEWEYACRGGTTTEYWFGDDMTKLGEHAWFIENSGISSRAVAQKPANPFGLYDMHGNVWEWCRDRWHDDYEGAPTDGSAWEKGGSSARVIRGGSWWSFADYCRSASRVHRRPSIRSVDLGFRPALTLG